jgi:hypothetical protein
MNVLPLDIFFFTESLSCNSPASFSRLGDGEMLCVLKQRGENCDHSEYFPELGAALRATLMRPYDYRHGIAPKILHRKNGLTERSLQWLERYSKVKQWYDSEVFLTAMLGGNLGHWTNLLQQRKVMLVGNVHLRHAPLSPTVFIEVPTINAWLNHDEILQQIERSMYQVDVVLFCTGMLSKVLLWELYPTYGRTHWLWDCGSVFDVFCGVMSRSYARKLTPAEIGVLKVKNFGK